MNFFKDFIKKHLFTFIVIGLLLIGIVVSVVVFMSSLQRKNTIEKKIKSELSLLKNFKTAKENAPTSEWIDYLKRKKEGLQAIFDGIMGEIDKSSTRMPEDVEEPLKFKEEIFEVQKRLREKAYADELELKEGAVSLGFKEYETKIPQEEEVPNLTKQLNIIQELIHLMCASNIKTVEKIEFLIYKDNVLENDEDKFSYRVFPVKLEITAPVKNLAEFLYKLSNSEFIFVVEGLNINSLVDKERVKSDLIISSVVFLKE